MMRLSAACSARLAHQPITRLTLVEDHMSSGEIDRLQLLGQRCYRRGLDSLEDAGPCQDVVHLRSFWDVVDSVSRVDKAFHTARAAYPKASNATPIIEHDKNLGEVYFAESDIE